MSLLVRDTMTPTNESHSNNSNLSASIQNKNSSITNKKMSSSTTTSSSSNITMIDMPSPPLSPYTRNNYDDNDTIPALLFPRASKPLTSDLRYLEHIYSNPIASSKSVSPSPAPISISEDQEKVVEKVEEEKEEKEEKVDSNNTHSIITPNENSLLHINPYKQLNKPGFKKIQLDFLSQYQFKTLNPTSSSSSNSTSNYSNSSYSYNKRPVRAAVRHSYDTIKSHNDNSNSDSDFERPRTRRIVRQNNFELELEDNTSLYDSSSISRPATPVKKRASNPSNPSTPKRQRISTPVVYNYDYKKIEDFCPSLDTLPNNNKCLKTDWKGQSMDLSNDPLVTELHPAEVVLASILRLPCAVYLDSKRRIFQEKVRRMKSNLPFRRTDAQKSCKIDVNKASRLFASFEKVGWFNESHFQKYL